MRRKLLMATAAINLGILVLSMFAAKYTEHVYFSIAAAIYSVAWLLCFVNANIDEITKPAGWPAGLARRIKAVIAKRRRA